MLIVSQVDGNGRPLAMVDASGSYSGNPSGRAFEHNWSDYYDQHIQGHGRLIGAGAPATRLQTAEPLQVFRVTLDTTSAALALIDSHAKFTASTFDENLVASNVEAFIPYIPGGTYANLGTSQIISVTQPLSNTAQYIARITGGAAMTYHLTLETFQEGGLTTTTTFTQTISLGETQGTASQLSAPGGVITFSASSPVTLPNVTVTPTAIQMSGLPSSLASTIVAVSEMSGRQALNNAVVSIGTLTNQAGQTISGSSFIVTPPSFNVAPAGNQNVLLQINVPNVGLGLYLGNMTITSANGSGFLIPLSLKVEALTINLPLITR